MSTDPTVAAEVRGPTQSDRKDSQSTPKWFAVRTRPRHEKRVAQYLDRKEIENYLPLTKTPRKWRDGSKGILDLPLFPGYLFVHIDRNARLPVLLVPGTLAFVSGTKGEPIAVPDEAIHDVQTGVRERAAEPHPLLILGERARIRSGALEGREGVVVRKENGVRFVMTLQQIGSSFSIIVPEDDLEPLAHLLDVHALDHQISGGETN